MWEFCITGNIHWRYHPFSTLSTSMPQPSQPPHDRACLPTGNPLREVKKSKLYLGLDLGDLRVSTTAVIPVLRSSSLEVRPLLFVQRLFFPHGTGSQCFNEMSLIRFVVTEVVGAELCVCLERQGQKD
jgi:hypothetical protein